MPFEKPNVPAQSGSSVKQYSKAIAAGVWSMGAWVAANVQITDGALVIPLTPEAGAMAAAAIAAVYAVWRVPNEPPK